MAMTWGLCMQIKTSSRWLWRELNLNPCFVCTLEVPAIYAAKILKWQNCWNCWKRCQLTYCLVTIYWLSIVELIFLDISSLYHPSGAMVQGRLLTRSEVAWCSTLPDISILRAELCSILSSSSSNLSQNLMHHQLNLSQSLASLASSTSSNSSDSDSGSSSDSDSGSDSDSDSETKEKKWKQVFFLLVGELRNTKFQTFLFCFIFLIILLANK